MAAGAPGTAIPMVGEHAKHFKTKAAGDRWLNEVTASIVTGSYVDPRAGQQTLRQ